MLTYNKVAKLKMRGEYKRNIFTFWAGKYRTISVITVP